MFILVLSAHAHVHVLVQREKEVESGGSPSREGTSLFKRFKMKLSSLHAITPKDRASFLQTLQKAT